MGKMLRWVYTCDSCQKTYIWYGGPQEARALCFIFASHAAGHTVSVRHDDGSTRKAA